MRQLPIFPAVFFLAGCCPAFAQITPLDLWVSPGVVSPGDTVCVSLRASPFSPVYLFQLGLEWEPGTLHFLSADTAGCPGAPSIVFGTSDVANGRLIALGGSAGPGYTDSSCLFRICFAADPSAWGEHLIRLYTGYPHEFYDTNLEVIPYSFTPGNILINSPPPPLQLVWAAASPAGCRGAGGIVELELAGGAPPYLFQWSGAQGIVSTAPKLTGAAPGTYFLEVKDQFGQTLRDTFDIKNSGTPPDLRSSTVEHATCRRPNGCVHLVLQGGAGPFTVRWDDDPGAPPERCGLLPGVYRVQVTDTAGCTVHAGFSVLDAPGFTLDREAKKNNCFTPGFITLKPSGGTPPYQTLWNTGDTTLTLNQVEVGYYRATVTDATGCSVERETFVHDVNVFTTYGLSKKFDCPVQLEDGALGLYFNSLNNPDVLPLTLEWHVGQRDTVWTDDPDSAEVQLRQIPPGLHYCVIREASGCAFVSGGYVDCTPPADLSQTSSVTFSSGPENFQAQKDSCMLVGCSGCEQVTDLQGTLAWLPGAMQLQLVEAAGATALSAWDFRADSAQGRLQFYWHTPDGQGKAVGNMFKVCFLPRDSTIYASELSIDYKPAELLARTADGAELPVVALSGVVVFVDYFTEFKIYGGKISAATCSSDGKREFQPQLFMPFEVYYNAIPLDGQATQPLYQLRAKGLSEGRYFISASQPVYGADRALVSLPPQNADPCVWPGDADNNGSVNHFDLLYLGLGNETAGPARPEPAGAWSGYSAAPWGQRTSVRSVDYQNIDTDGNGLIEAADTLAIVQNWGRVVDQGKDAPYEGPFLSPRKPDAPLLSVPGSTLLSGEQALLPLSWGTTAPAQGAYGLAFSLRYDTALVGEDIRFVPGASWFGDPASGELLCVQRNFRQWGLLSVALTRLDGQTASGNGAIGHFAFTAGNLPLPGTRTGNWEIYKALAMGPAEQALPLNAGKTTLTVIRPAVPANEPVSDGGTGIRIWPNPAGSRFFLEIKGGALARVQLFNLAGQLVLSREAGTVERVEIPVAGLPEGGYMVKVITTEGTVFRKIAVQRE